LYQYKINLVRIIDGDSAVIDIDYGFNVWRKETHFRLFGWQAAELRSSDEKERFVAREAKKILEGFFSYHIEYVFDSQKDSTGKYGRVLGNIRHESVPQLNWEKILYNHGMLVPYGTSKEKELEYWHELYEKLND